MKPFIKYVETYGTLETYDPKSKELPIKFKDIERIDYFTGFVRSIYKDKKSCDSSYDWQKILNDKNSNEIYTEFKDFKCVLANPVMRKICEDNNINYNYDTQLCEVDEKFCKAKNLEFVEKNNVKDCKIPIDKNFG